MQHINPDNMLKNPAFTQVITTFGPGKTIYIGGQNAVKSDGEIVGKSNLAEQTVQVMTNLQNALIAAGADMSHLVKMTIYLVQGQDAYAAFMASQKFFANASPPTISVLFIAGLVNPEYLLEIDAIAFVPD